MAKGSKKKSCMENNIRSVTITKCWAALSSYPNTAVGKQPLENKQFTPKAPKG